jgi:predicted ATP-dependent protease
MDQDPDFPRLFKVAADFEDRILRDSEAETRYAALLATLGRQEGLLPLTAEGVARMVEESARLVGDAERLTTNLGRLADILREADYWARREDKEAIYLGDVERALQEQEYRLGRVPERFREEILRDVVAISTEGSRIAQVNGISVVEVGDMAFGLPSRITATAWLGEGEIIDIEREVELGGALHSKGVLILSQFLGARYARTRPLSVTASLVFEQSYGPLDGDSASLGELCALLSALAEIPMAQHLAVSGSVNQLGEVQAIGSVNEKVEGFFAICNARGLSGNQGMILPRTNLVNLMLRRDVVRAVTEGRFHLYAVDHVDQAMSLLAGMPAGEADAEGNFPEDSVNGRVTARLVHLAELRKDDDEKKHRGRSEHEHA